jgi:hypothetical protein
MRTREKIRTAVVCLMPVTATLLKIVKKNPERCLDKATKVRLQGRGCGFTSVCGKLHGYGGLG